MNQIEILGQEYIRLLNQQKFDEEHLDYGKVHQHKVLLENMARISNSGITLFDMYKKEHLYSSYNFANLLGYEVSDNLTITNEYFDSKIHPDDFLELMQNGIQLLEFCFSIAPEERLKYKLVNEYRVLNREGNYIRVIEQHQPMELDYKGNVWLTLGIIDISPNQNEFNGVKSQLINFDTGSITQYPQNEESQEMPQLSKREQHILKLIKGGFLSKEISEELSISVHTVNTHRQRILEKLNANNSIEAINLANRLGLVN